MIPFGAGTRMDCVGYNIGYKMDKIQNELIKTYFRKREEKEEKLDYDDLTEYEVRYLYQTRNKNPHKFTMTQMLVLFPEKRDLYSDYINSFNGTEVRIALMLYPSLVDVLPIYKMNNMAITRLLRNRPDFVDKFPVKELDGTSICTIILAQPQLVDKLDVYRLDGEDVSNILTVYPTPEMVNKLPVWNLRGLEYNYICKIHGELKPLIDNKIRGNG